VRALLDEQLPAQIAVLLRHAGHDVLAVADRADLLGCSDRLIFEVASREDRALVTNNVKDFRPLAAERLAAGRTHPGLVLLPSARTRTRAVVPALAAAIETILRTHPEGIPGSERWVGPLPPISWPDASDLLRPAPPRL
jgi:predicted nuclease of predicted toxin-antitoxin system